jgi:hypothetical protein
MDNTIDFTNCEDTIETQIDMFVGTYDIKIDRDHIPVNEWSRLVEENFDEILYELIYENYDVIINNADMYDAVKPSNNSYTRSLLEIGYNEREALIMAIYLIAYISKKLIF